MEYCKVEKAIRRYKASLQLSTESRSNTTEARPYLVPRSERKGTKAITKMLRQNKSQLNNTLGRGGGGCLVIYSSFNKSASNTKLKKVSVHKVGILLFYARSTKLQSTKFCSETISVLRKLVKKILFRIITRNGYFHERKVIDSDRLSSVKLKRKVTGCDRRTLSSTERKVTDCDRCTPRQFGSKLGASEVAEGEVYRWRGAFRIGCATVFWTNLKVIISLCMAEMSRARERC